MGRKGRAETFFEANVTLLPEHPAGYLLLLFGAQALRREGTFGQILERSLIYGIELGGRLRERVYNDVLPALATVVAAHHRAGERGPSELMPPAMVRDSLIRSSTRRSASTPPKPTFRSPEI